MDESHSLLVEATRKLVELRSRPIWNLHLPPRLPPVLWFGDAHAKRKVVTLGANPSRKEFIADSAKVAMEKVQNGDHSTLRYLEPGRFRVLSASETLDEVIESESLRNEIILGYNNYFDRKPYTRWFGRNGRESYKVEQFLRGYGTSYYHSGAYRAVHIDLLPFTTLSDFKSIKDEAEALVFENRWAEGFLRRLIRWLNPEAIIAFGLTNCEYFARYIDESLCFEWTNFRESRFCISESFGVPVVCLSTNLGNPIGYDRNALWAFGEKVMEKLRSKSTNRTASAAEKIEASEGTQRSGA